MAGITINTDKQTQRQTDRRSDTQTELLTIARSNIARDAR